MKNNEVTPANIKMAEKILDDLHESEWTTLPVILINKKEYDEGKKPQFVKTVDYVAQILANARPEPPPDDPEVDCTDLAHPAWWRGHEHTVKSMCQMINNILDGKETLSGISSQPWENTRQRLFKLWQLDPHEVEEIRRMRKEYDEEVGGEG